MLWTQTQVREPEIAKPDMMMEKNIGVKDNYKTTIF